MFGGVMKVILQKFMLRFVTVLKDFFFEPISSKESRIIACLFLCTIVSIIMIKGYTKYLISIIDNNIDTKLDKVMKKMEIEESVCSTTSDYFWGVYWNPTLYNTQDRFEESISFVGQIVIYGAEKSGGAGTLVVYKGKMLLITATHVIDDVALESSNNIALRYRGSLTSIPLSDFISDPANDLSVAICKIEIRQEDLPILKLDPEVQLNKGDEVVGYGYPHFFFAFTSGAIRSIYSNRIEVTSQIYYGFSGGPMVVRIEDELFLAGVIRDMQNSSCTGAIAIHPKIVARLADKLLK